MKFHLTSRWSGKLHTCHQP